MDPSTLHAYDSSAREFAADWEDEQSPPTDLQALVRQYFLAGKTVDIGCGSGRDADWLTTNGYPTLGVDASSALLDEARSRHPNVSFIEDSLPQLAMLASEQFDNVLCETVIMH